MAGIQTIIKWYGKEQEKRLTTGINNGIKKCGFRIEKDAKQLCVVDTGRLRASISTNWTNSGMTYGKVDDKAEETDGVTQPNDNQFTVQVGTRVEYASCVEFGTIYVPQRPFLFPAYEMNIGKLSQFIKGEIPEKAVIG